MTLHLGHGRHRQPHRGPSRAEDPVERVRAPGAVRCACLGLAQLRFEEIWPDLLRLDRPTESTLRGLSSPKLLELRELIGQIVVAQGRKVVVFSQWRRMLRLAHWATQIIQAAAGAPGPPDQRPVPSPGPGEAD